MHKHIGEIDYSSNTMRLKSMYVKYIYVINYTGQYLSSVILYEVLWIVWRDLFCYIKENWQLHSYSLSLKLSHN